MSSHTTINGVVLTDRIAFNLRRLQSGDATLIADALDNAIAYLLEDADGCSNPGQLLSVLASLHTARTELLDLMPGKEDAQ